MTRMICEGRWHDFDDISLFECIRFYAQESCDELSSLKARSILERTPPRLVYDNTFLGKREGTCSGRPLYYETTHLLETKKNEWAKEFGMDPDRWRVWPRIMELTKVGSHELDAADDAKKESEQAARVRIDEDSLKSEAITRVRQSLMNVMADYANYMVQL